MSSLLRRVIFVYGGPGSGKGTACLTLSRTFGLLHLSAGEALRQQLETPGSQYQSVIQGHIDAGTIVPGYITAALLVSAIEKSETTGVLVDGFPRNIDNFNAWFDAVKGHQIDSNSAIHFKCSEQVMLERIQKRGRADDNAEAFASRVKVYLNDSIPLLDKYKTVLEVNAAQTVEAVNAEMLEKFPRVFPELT